MDQKFVVVIDDKFSHPMSRDEAIKTVKSYDHKGVTAYMVSEKEAEKIKTS